MAQAPNTRSFSLSAKALSYLPTTGIGGRGARDGGLSGRVSLVIERYHAIVEETQERILGRFTRDELDLLAAAHVRQVVNTRALPYDAIKPVAINVAAKDLDPDLRARLGRLSNAEACALVEYFESRGVRA